MAKPQSLEEIIRKECLPLRDCMLTITDAHGEAAFLYFKEAELIEANYAALWGKEALAQIVSWKLADSTVAPLPLGIKRSLWDQIERGKETILFEADGETEDTKWLVEFSERAKSVGDTLGFGICEKWTLDT